MESLSALDITATSSPLVNAIHPMFGRVKWDQDRTLPRHLPLIPLFTGNDGFWQVGFQYLQAAIADDWYLSRSAIQPYGASSIPHSGLPPIFYPTLRCGRGKIPFAIHPPKIPLIVTLQNRWDALFNGFYNSVKSFRIPPEYRHMTLLQFSARGPEIQASQEARKKLKQNILELHEGIRFGFFSGYTNPWQYVYCPF
jgi:hypothetical protein